ncbi:hypothetical protein TNCV_4168481 [Trichonephila clavipes]|nr:hypothetical protein TNCV_4168481 [Trichonephila clavipes]
MSEYNPVKLDGHNTYYKRCGFFCHYHGEAISSGHLLEPRSHLISRKEPGGVPLYHWRVGRICRIKLSPDLALEFSS